MLLVPPAARVASWLNAWLCGGASADAVIGGLNAAGSAEFALPDGSAPMSAALLLGELRRQGAARASLALPVPGDPLGLGGPPEFNVDAVDTGEAVVVHGPDIGFVPVVGGDHVRWRGGAAIPPAYLPDIASADTQLRAAVLEAAERLAELDVAAWGPDVADALMNLRSGSQSRPPCGSTRRGQHRRPPPRFASWPSPTPPTISSQDRSRPPRRASVPTRFALSRPRLARPSSPPAPTAD